MVDKQDSRLGKAFAKKASANMKIRNTQLSKIFHSGGFPARLVSTLVRVDLSWMKNVLTALSKSVLIALELTAASSALDEAVKNYTGNLK